MIGFLDELDGDADDEPSLGAGGPHEQRTQAIWAEGTTDDREQECEDEGAGDEDNEPSLGWPETGTAGQSFRNMGGPHDYEEQCEDEGAQCDDEGCRNDNGIADSDGLLEQVGGDQPGFGASGFAKYVE